MQQSPKPKNYEQKLFVCAAVAVGGNCVYLVQQRWWWRFARHHHPIGINASVGRQLESNLLFDDDDGDETSKFNGYTFTFTTAGEVTASLNGVNKTGIWIVRQDDGRTELEIDFNDDDDPLDELDEDWDVTELTNNRIKLEDLDDDNDDDEEYLTLEKI